MDIFGKRLRELRNAMGVNQQDVANSVNVSQGTYSGYERGNTPSVEALIGLARYFNVSIDYLLGISAQVVTKGGQPDQLFARLSRVPMPDVDTAPSVTAFIALINAIIAYRAAGSPLGDSPLITAGSVIDATTNLLDASAATSTAELIDAANVLAAAGLQANDVVKEFIVRTAPKE